MVCLRMRAHETDDLFTIAEPICRDKYILGADFAALPLASRLGLRVMIAVLGKKVAQSGFTVARCAIRPGPLPAGQAAAVRRATRRSPVPTWQRPRALGW